MQLVVFIIGKEEYGFNIQEVQEIVIQQKTTEIPNMATYIEGVINLRGKIVPVINLAKKFNIEYRKDKDNTTRLIVLNLQNGVQIAVKADEVTEVLTVKEEDIKSPPEIKSNIKENCLTGIAEIKGNLVMLLDAKSILDYDEIESMEIC